MKEQSLFYREKRVLSFFLAMALVFICVFGGREIVIAEESAPKMVNAAYSDDVTYLETAETTEPAESAVVTMIVSEAASQTTTTTTKTTTTEKYIVSSEVRGGGLDSATYVESITFTDIDNQNYAYNDIKYNLADIEVEATIVVEYFYQAEILICYWSDGSETALGYDYAYRDSYSETKHCTLSHLIDSYDDLEYSSPAEAYEALCPDMDKDIDTEIGFTINGQKSYMSQEYISKYDIYVENYEKMEYDYTSSFPVHIYEPGTVITQVTTSAPVTTTTTTTTAKTTTTTTTTKKYVVSSSVTNVKVTEHEIVKEVSVSVSNQNYSYDDKEFNTDDIMLDVTYRYCPLTQGDIWYYYWSDGSVDDLLSYDAGKSYDVNRQYTLSELNPEFEHSSPAEVYEELCPFINKDIDTEIEFSCSIPRLGKEPYTYTDTIPIHISAPETVVTTVVPVTSPATTTSLITALSAPVVTHTVTSISIVTVTSVALSETMPVSMSVYIPPETIVTSVVPVTSIITTTTTTTGSDKYIVSSEEVWITVAPEEKVKEVSISISNQNYSYYDTEFNTDDIILDVTYEYYHSGGGVTVYYYWSDDSVTYEFKSGTPTSYDFNRQYTLSELDPEFDYSSPAKAYMALCPNMNKDIDADIEFSCEIVEPFYGGSDNYYTYTGSIPMHFSAPEAIVTSIVTVTSIATTTTTTTTTTNITDKVIVSSETIPITAQAAEIIKSVSVHADYNEYSFTDSEYLLDSIYLDITSERSVGGAEYDIIYYYSDGTTSMEYVLEPGTLVEENKTVSLASDYIYDLEFEYSSPSEAFNKLFPGVENRLIETEVSFSCAIEGYPYVQSYSFSGTMPLYIIAPSVTYVSTTNISSTTLTTVTTSTNSSTPATTSTIVTTSTPPSTTTTTVTTSSTPVTTPEVPAETESLNIVINNLTVIVISCDEAAVNVVVPSRIGGNVVAEIGKYAFYNCDNLQMVTIENPDCEIYDDATTINENAVISGYWNSTAHDYAIKYNREFYSLNGEPEYVSGDISGNGVIDLYDAIEICKKIMGMRTFTDQEMKIADYNGDGVVDLYDAIGIAKKLIEK